jgi:ribosomal protein S26
VYLCFVWISEQTAIISLYSINCLVFIRETECVYCAVRTGSLTIPSKAQWLLYVPPGLTFSNCTFCSHSVFMCFMWISEQTAIISLYSINCLVFIRETECVYCAVRTGSLTIPSKAQWLLYVPPGLTFSNCTFCPHSVFMCFVWISEQTAIISLYSIN